MAKRKLSGKDVLHMIDQLSSSECASDEVRTVTYLTPIWRTVPSSHQMTTTATVIQMSRMKMLMHGENCLVLAVILHV